MNRLILCMAEILLKLLKDRDLVWELELAIINFKEEQNIK